MPIYRESSTVKTETAYSVWHVRLYPVSIAIVIISVCLFSINTYTQSREHEKEKNKHLIQFNCVFHSSPQPIQFSSVQFNWKKFIRIARCDVCESSPLLFSLSFYLTFVSLFHNVTLVLHFLPLSCSMYGVLCCVFCVDVYVCYAVAVYVYGVCVLCLSMNLR